MSALVDDSEIWGFVIALCVLGVLYFGGDVVRGWAEETREAYRWGQRQRRARTEAAWWASHEFCLAVLAISLYAFFRWAIP